MRSRGPVGRSPSSAALLVAAGALLALAALLRLVALDAGWFGVDQARDLAWARSIAEGSAFPTLGPAMRNRVHLGATYYFFWAIPALLSAQPIAAYAFAGMLGVAAVGGAGLLAWRIGGPVAGVAAIAWLATSPMAAIDSRIAWAPAALPPACAAILLTARALLVAPSRWKAAGLALLAGLATQLHLAAAALAPVAGGTLLARARLLGGRGLALAALAGIAPLVPMAAAWREVWVGPPPTAPASSAPGAAPVVASPYAHRLSDLLLLAPRWLDGLCPAADERPWLASAWLPLEVLAIVVPLAAAVWLGARASRSREPASVRLIVAALAACLAIPALLPLEVWGYYLDGALVPAAILVGLALAQLRRRRLAAGALALLCIGRTAFLAWWIGLAASQGFVPANLDLLRLGGARPDQPAARGRLLDVATKERAARVLTGEIAIPPDRLWRDVHGPGFADLDTDNGFFLLPWRAGASGRATAESATEHALAIYAHELPPDWLAGFAAPHRAGPLEIYAYRPVLRLDEAVLEGCGGGSLPRQAIPHPLDYGRGEPHLPAWPCERPVVVVPFTDSPRAVAVRVLPRVNGAGRVLSVEARPAAGRAHSDAPGFGDGVVLGPGAGELRLELAIDGPAALDLVELHGQPAAAPGDQAPAAPPDAAGAPLG